ncbi:MAG: excinuclease ABC subunit UvrC [Acidimicrobiales bacterium]
MVQRPPAGSIPESPGSYQFKDADGRVIYVGKAKSLRSRLNSYFGNPNLLHPKTAQMVGVAETVEWIEVKNEIEAFFLEYNLIKQHRPRFNIRLKDDKSYPFLAVTTSEEWPRAMVRRGTKDKGSRYFGPYAHAWAIRDTLDQLLRTFPVRTCSENKFNRHHRLGRACLLFDIEKCSGPCVDAIDKLSYDHLVTELCAFLDGDTDPIVKRLETDMLDASDRLEFERAARLRDRLGAVRRAIERQQMVTEKPEDVDVIGMVEDELEAAVQIFYVRHGRVVGRKGVIVDKVEDLEPGPFVVELLTRLYAEAPLGVPREVLVPNEPESDDLAATQGWLSELRGSRVTVRQPQRGDKKALQETVTRNAKEEFQRHRMRRASDHNSRAKALNALQEALDLPEAPLRIECYDMAHFQGSDYVGSMVVMEDGLPNKNQYRRFKVKEVPGNDDYAAMEEVLTRRLGALLAERDRPVGDRPRKFAYPPQLLLVDGGRGQLNVAARVLEELGLDEEIPVAGLAKQFEEIYLPGREDPVRISRSSESLYLLQTIRDEAHRFANTYHRQLRDKRMTKSVIDDVPGLGETRRKRLLKELGGVTAVRTAPLETLKDLTWLPNKVAEALYLKIHR